MERSGMNSLPETLHDAQKSILKSNKKPPVMVAITDPSTSEDRLKQHDDSHSRQCDGMVAVIEQQISKPQTPASTVMPTPTSTERRFTDSFYWMSHLHKKVGLSHIILLVVLATYSALGAVVFYYLETPNERIVVAARKELLDDRIEQLAEHLTGMAENKTIEELAVDVKAAYIDMLNTEGSYKWSTFYRSDDPRNNYKWTYASSFFFAMNVYTTTGYGSIAPETRSGQWFVIIYGFIFVPVTLVVIRDLGQWLLLVITRNYAKMLLKCRHWRRRKSNNLNEVIRLPILFSCVIMLGFIGFCTVFVYYLDAFSGPPGSGLDWFHSMYFSYMSFTTIGLGDVMPSNATFAPIVSILFFLGLPIMKVVNRMTYLTVENGAFGLLTVIENRIDNFWKEKQATTAKDVPSTIEIATETKDGCNNREIPNEWVNNITIHSIATFMKANRDVYGGSFGKVNLRAADVLSSNEQDTVLSVRSHHQPL